MKSKAEREQHLREEHRKIWYPDERTEDTPISSYEPDACTVCGREMVEGDWPFCNGDMSDHITARSSRNAQRLLTVVYENAQGKVWVPTGDSACPPKGYERVELTTLQQVDKYMDSLSRVQNERHQIYTEQEREQWNAHLKQVRGEMNSHGVAWRNPQTGQLEMLPGLHSMSPQGRDMYEEALRRYSEYNPARPLPIHVEAQFFDHQNIDRE